MVQVRRLDWEDTDSSDSETTRTLECDAVVAADCVYDPGLAESLAKMLKRVLDQNNGHDGSGGHQAFGVVANTVRQPETIAAFQTSLRAHGLAWSELMADGGDVGDVPQIFPHARPAHSILWKITAQRQPPE
jgi:hypothetical protein